MSSSIGSVPPTPAASGPGGEDHYIFNPNDPSFQAFINEPIDVAELPDDLDMAPEAYVAARAEARALAVQQTIDAYASAGSPEAGLEAAAQAAARSASGPNARLLGTDAHRILELAVQQIRTAGEPVDAEVSYLDGEVVPRGTPGSVRVDALTGTDAKPTEIVDLKTGRAGLPASRIAEIRRQLPEEFKQVPIREVR